MNHVPTFRPLGLHAGYGQCIHCGQRITREQWATGICPGPLTVPAEPRRPT